MSQENVQTIKARLAQIEEAREWLLCDPRINQTFNHIEQEIRIAVYQIPKIKLTSGEKLDVIELSKNEILKLTQSLGAAVDALEKYEKVSLWVEDEGRRYIPAKSSLSKIAKIMAGESI